LQKALDAVPEIFIKVVRKFREMQQKGLPVDAEVFRFFSRYRPDHSKRLGDYLLDLQRSVPPSDSTIDFAFN